MIVVVILLIVAGSLGMLGRQVVGTANDWTWVGKWLKDGIQLIGK